MADEAQVQSSLTVIKRDATTGKVLIQHKSPVSAFQAGVEGAKGPVGGALTIPVTGVDISLSGLTTPGLCEFRCTGRVDGSFTAGDRVIVGIHDGALFHPFLDVLPGEQFVVRLSEDLGEETTIAGTGTTATVNTLHAYAVGASLVLIVGAFEK